MEAEKFRGIDKGEKSQTRAPATTMLRSLRTRSMSSLVCCIHHTRFKSTILLSENNFFEEAFGGQWLASWRGLGFAKNDECSGWLGVFVETECDGL